MDERVGYAVTVHALGGVVHVCQPGATDGDPPAVVLLHPDQIALLIDWLYDTRAEARWQRRRMGADTSPTPSQAGEADGGPPF